MAAVLQRSWEPFADAWTLALRHFPAIHGNSFLSSSSSGGLSIQSFDSAAPVSLNKNAHESSVNALEKIDEYTVASAATDGVKVWDLRQSLSRAQATLSNAKKSSFLSLGSSKGQLLAGGTELVGSDAEIHVWDLKKAASVVRSFVDSHHDDITDIKFHDSLPYLMSGSTDGYVNVYNLDEPDEDEALHQVINFASVHSCHFIRPNRISVLSHMETLAFWELNSTDYENAAEPAPKEIGDVRSLWPDCEYVVDIADGYVAYGANSKSSLTIMPFDAGREQFDLSSRVTFAPAHGEEVVRDVMYVPGTNSVLTCGEDGLIKAWTVPGMASGKKAEVGSAEKREKMERRREKKERREKRSKEARFKPY